MGKKGKKKRRSEKHRKTTSRSESQRKKGGGKKLEGTSFWREGGAVFPIQGNLLPSFRRGKGKKKGKKTKRVAQSGGKKKGVAGIEKKKRGGKKSEMRGGPRTFGRKITFWTHREKEPSPVEKKGVQKTIRKKVPQRV